MQSLINTNGLHSNAKWLLDQSRRSLDANMDEIRQASNRKLVIPYTPLADLKSCGLLRRAKRRTEITEFVVDLVRAFDRLSNFLAEQGAITFA